MLSDNATYYFITFAMLKFNTVFYKYVCIYIHYGYSVLMISLAISRLTIVSHEAKQKQAVHDEQVCYLN